MSTYVELRDALYDLIEAVDITPSFPGETAPEDAIWRVKLDRPPKSDELTAFPAFSVQPARDLPATADTETDETGFTFFVRLYVLWNDADDNEAQIQEIASLVRRALINERMQDEVLDGLCHRLSFSGAWSGDETQGHRIYQLEVTCYTTETYEAPAP